MSYVIPPPLKNYRTTNKMCLNVIKCDYALTEYLDCTCYCNYKSIVLNTYFEYCTEYCNDKSFLCHFFTSVHTRKWQYTALVLTSNKIYMDWAEKHLPAQDCAAARSCKCNQVLLVSVRRTPAHWSGCPNEPRSNMNNKTQRKQSIHTRAFCLLRSSAALQPKITRTSWKHYIVLTSFQ